MIMAAIKNTTLLSFNGPVLIGKYRRKAASY
jgi:hypothetical protein